MARDADGVSLAHDGLLVVSLISHVVARLHHLIKDTWLAVRDREEFVVLHAIEDALVIKGPFELRGDILLHRRQ